MAGWDPPGTLLSAIKERVVRLSASARERPEAAPFTVPLDRPEESRRWIPQRKASVLRRPTGLLAARVRLGSHT